MAPRAGAAAVTANALDEIRKSRRDNLGMAAPPQNTRCFFECDRAAVIGSASMAGSCLLAETQQIDRKALSDVLKHLS
jgi:hypothetical protein